MDKADLVWRQKSRKPTKSSPTPRNARRTTSSASSSYYEAALLRPRVLKASPALRVETPSDLAASPSAQAWAVGVAAVVAAVRGHSASRPAAAGLAAARSTSPTPKTSFPSSSATARQVVAWAAWTRMTFSAAPCLEASPAAERDPTRNARVPAGFRRSRAGRRRLRLRSWRSRCPCRWKSCSTARSRR